MIFLMIYLSKGKENEIKQNVTYAQVGQKNSTGFSEGPTYH